jgi:hypothetical protein
MKKVEKMAGLALLFAAVLGVVAPSYASQPRYDPFAYELKPTVHPRSAGPVDMAFSFAPEEQFCEGCDELRVTLITEGRLEFHGEKSWTVQADKEHPYSTILHINVPRDDTCSLWVRMQCCRIKQTIGCYFVTIGDSIEYWTGNPRYYHPSPPSPKTNDPIRDTLTQEQLQTVYEVRLDLRDSTERKLVEQIIGSKLDSPRRHGRSIFFRVKMNLEKFIEIKKQNIDARLLKPHRPWHKEPNDSVPGQTPQDSAEQQGSLDSRLNPNSPDGFSLEYVDGMTSPGILPTNQETGNPQLAVGSLL